MISLAAPVGNIYSESWLATRAAKMDPSWQNRVAARTYKVHYSRTMSVMKTPKTADESQKKKKKRKHERHSWFWIKLNLLAACMISPLLTRLVQLRWLDISVVLFCIFIDLDFVSVLKNSKRRELGQYPTVLTSRLVNNAYLLTRPSPLNSSPIPSPLCSSLNKPLSSILAEKKSKMKKKLRKKEKNRKEKIKGRRKSNWTEKIKGEGKKVGERKGRERKGRSGK